MNRQYTVGNLSNKPSTDVSTVPPKTTSSFPSRAELDATFSNLLSTQNAYVKFNEADVDVCLSPAEGEMNETEELNSRSPDDAMDKADAIRYYNELTSMVTLDSISHAIDVLVGARHVGLMTAKSIHSAMVTGVYDLQVIKTKYGSELKKRSSTGKRISLWNCKSQYEKQSRERSNKLKRKANQGSGFQDDRHCQSDKRSWLPPHKS